MIPRKGIIKRRKPPKKATKQPHRKPVKRKNVARKNQEWARAYGSPERVQWFKSQPCILCGAEDFTANAHTVGGGGSRKGPAESVIPLCDSRFTTVGCHQLFDRRELDVATRALLIASAPVWAKAWQAHSAPPSGTTP